MVVRHPLLGAFGGALVGLGVALLFVMFEFTPLDTLTLVGTIGFFALIGIIYALVLPPPRLP
jgi:hypothetical protein